MATTSAAQLDKLLKGTDLAQQQQASLEAIRQEIAELIKKGDKLSKEDEKRIDALKDEIVALHKVASIERRKEIASIIKEFKLSLESIKDDWVEYSDNIKLSYLNLENQFQETMSETQVLMEEKLTQIGELVGTKISIAAEFVGTKVKTVITGALNAMEKRINTVFSNLGGSIKTGFSKLKNTIMSPIEFIKSLPGKILGFVKSGLMLVYNLTKSLLRFTYNVIVGAIRLALVSIVKIFKGIVWVVSKIFQGLYWAVKQAFSFIYKSFVKIFSFITGVLWSAIKTIGSFVLNVMWTTIKTIASTVVKVAYTIAKTLVQTIVTAVLAAFSPWLGLLALVGVGIYFLGRYFGWWGGGADTKPGAPEKGGFFSGIWDAFIAKADEWWGAISKYFWDGNGNGVIEKAVYSLWNPRSGEPGYIQKFFGITGDFFSSMWNKLLEFGKWLFYGPQKKTFTENYNSLGDKKEKISDVLKDFSQAKAAPLKQGFAGLIPIISEWWDSTGANKVKDWIFGKDGVIEWVKTKANNLGEIILPYIFGDGGSFSNPTGGLMGAIYDIIFGQKSLNWNTNTGLLGTIKTFVLENVTIPILDFVSEKILSSLKELMVGFGAFLQQSGFKETGQMFVSAGQKIDKGVSEVSRMARKTEALVTGGKIEHLQSEKENIESQDSERTSDQQIKISTIEAEISRLKKIKAENTKLSDPKFFEEKEQTKNLAEFDVESLSRFMYSFGLTSENFRSAFKNKDTRVNLGEILFNDWSHLFAFDGPNMGMDSSWVVTKFSSNIPDTMIRSYSDDHEAFDVRTKDARKHFDEGKKLGLFNENDISNLNKLINAATKMEMDQSLGYANFIENPFFRNLTKKEYLDMLGTSRRNWIWAGTKKETTEKDVFGMAMGGIIKPPNTKADMGRIITVAEAGDPEVVLPLNAEGIKYIKDISAALQPEKENNDMFNSLKELLEGKKVEESGPVKTRQFNPQLPAMNVKNSDSTQLDILKLVSLGILSK